MAGREVLNGYSVTTNGREPGDDFKVRAFGSLLSAKEYGEGFPEAMVVNEENGNTWIWDGDTWSVMLAGD